MKNCFFCILFPLIFSFHKNDKRFDNKDQALYKNADFPVGVAIKIKRLKNDAIYRGLVREQFNSFTAENIMKPSYLHPEKDVFYFDDADYLAEFCKKNNKRLHGHTLVWHKSLPSWVENFKGNKAAWEAMLKEHVKTIVIHYKGFINSWDVVNEAFNDDGSLRKNIWLKNIGESYIEKSFIYANEADPTAKLFYNDFNLEASRTKLNTVLQFVADLKSRGIKIDGIGMQMHVKHYYPDINAINQAAFKVQENGLLVHYSELSVSLNKKNKSLTLTNEMLTLQKKKIKEIVEGYMKLKKNAQFGITIWGLSDPAVAWQRDKNIDWPFLYDQNYNPKPAYYGFLEALTEKTGS